VGKGLYVTKFAHYSRIVFVIGKFAYIFQGGGSAGGILHGEGSFHAVNFSGEILN
jgi:hypothetical protein